MAAKKKTAAAKRGRRRVWVKAHKRRRPESWLSKKARQDRSMPF